MSSPDQASTPEGGSPFPGEPLDIQATKYKFYKPTTWFGAPKTAKYTRYERDEAPESEESQARVDVGTAEIREGTMLVWHGSIRRWRKCHVDATRSGLLIISRHGKRELHTPWAFQLEGCSIMLAAKHRRALAVHSCDGQLYLRTQHSKERSLWLRGITTSAEEFQQILKRSQSFTQVNELLAERCELQSHSQSALERKVASIVSTALEPLQPMMSDMAQILQRESATHPLPPSLGMGRARTTPTALPAAQMVMKGSGSMGVHVPSKSAEAGVPLGLESREGSVASVDPVPVVSEERMKSAGSRSQCPMGTVKDNWDGQASVGDIARDSRPQGGLGVSPRANLPNAVKTWQQVVLTFKSVVTDLATKVATLEVEATELEDALAQKAATVTDHLRAGYGLEPDGSEDDDSGAESSWDFRSATSTMAPSSRAPGLSSTILSSSLPSPLQDADSPSLGTTIVSSASMRSQKFETVRTVKFLSNVFHSRGDEKAAALADAPESSSSGASNSTTEEDDDLDSCDAAVRACLPNPAPLSMGISVWGILRSAIGKDLTKITLPATINEPLSALQRITEDMEQVVFLEKACASTFAPARALNVALFACTPVNSAILRYRKPFNPLLGETFEWSSSDGTHRSLAEQVSHHPPIACIHAEGPGYTVLGEMQLVTSFWGKAITMKNEGGYTATLADFAEQYTWKKPVFTLNNIIVGKMWIEAIGTTAVQCSNGCTASVTFDKCKGNLDHRGQLHGTVSDAAGTAHYSISGSAMSSVEVTPLTTQAVEALGGEAIGISCCVYTRPEDVPEVEAQYYMTRFAIALNDGEDPCLQAAAPTDCRLRPDMRLLENAQYDMSTEEKLRLEDKQRKAAAARKEAGHTYSPFWFARESHSGASELVKKDGLVPHVWDFTGKYWEHRADNAWDDCPDLYS